MSAGELASWFNQIGIAAAAGVVVETAKEGNKQKRERRGTKTRVEKMTDGME